MSKTGSWYPFRKKLPLQRRMSSTIYFPTGVELTSWMKMNHTVMRKILHNLWRFDRSSCCKFAFYSRFLLSLILNFQVQGNNIRECRILHVEASIMKPIFFIIWSFLIDWNFFSHSPIKLNFTHYYKDGINKVWSEEVGQIVAIFWLAFQSMTLRCR